MVRVSRIRYVTKCKHIAWRKRLMAACKFSMRIAQEDLESNPLNASANAMWHNCSKILARQRSYKDL